MTDAETTPREPTFDPDIRHAPDVVEFLEWFTEERAQRMLAYSRAFHNRDDGLDD